MCGVQRVPAIIFMNNGKYNAGLLTGLSPHTLPIYQLKGSVYEKYIYGWTKIVAILLAKCAS
jgi:hypothetical protein